MRLAAANASTLYTAFRNLLRCFPHLGLHEQAGIAGDLRQRAAEDSAGTEQSCQAITVCMPGSLGITEAKFLGELLADSHTTLTQRGQRACGSSKLHDQGFVEAGCQAFASAMNTGKPARRFKSKCDWPRSLQERPT